MSESSAVAETADRILQTISSIDHIGPIQQFTSRLVGMLGGQNTDINELARNLSREPVACIQVLRLANSTYFSRGLEIRTVRQAIVHLGLSVVKKLVVAFEMIGIFRDDDAFMPFGERTFLKSSIGGALICERLGRKLGLRESDELFTCGLVRDFGVIILKQYFPDLLREISNYAVKQQCSYRIASQEVCGFDHRFISFLLFTKWNMPAGITAGFQERPAAEGFRALHAKIVTQSDRILKELDYGQWDRHAQKQDNESDLFSFCDDDFMTMIKEQLITEADEFVQAMGM